MGPYRQHRDQHLALNPRKEGVWIKGTRLARQVVERQHAGCDWRAEQHRSCHEEFEESAEGQQGALNDLHLGISGLVGRLGLSNDGRHSNLSLLLLFFAFVFFLLLCRSLTLSGGGLTTFLRLQLFGPHASINLNDPLKGGQQVGNPFHVIEGMEKQRVSDAASLIKQQRAQLPHHTR